MEDKLQTENSEASEITVSSFILAKNGLIPIGKPTFEQWQECGRFIRKAEGAVHFWIGDWVNYGEPNFGEKYTQALEETGFDYDTLRHDAYVASHVDLCRRRHNLSWAIHAEVAPFEPEEQEELLKKAEELRLTRKELRKEKHRFLLEKERPLTILDPNLFLGNCLEEIPKLPNNSIDCLITDPPYGIDYQSQRREVKEQLPKLEGDKEQAFDLLDQMCQLIDPKIKINSHLYFFTTWKTYCEFKAIISKYFEIKNVLVWDKVNHGSGDLEGNYAERYELIIFASKGRRILNGIREDNILVYSKNYNLEHPTEKPVGLIEKLIEKSSNENELIFDPFMGSGSICIAAKNLHRKYIGIEIDKNWFELAQRRINEPKHN